jgi:hypothetical protein
MSNIENVSRRNLLKGVVASGFLLGTRVAG